MNFGRFTDRRLFVIPATVKLCESPGKAGGLPFHLLELVRYLHLNPVRAGIVGDLEALGRYAYSGHGALVGTRPHGWQDTEAVMS